MLKGEAPSYSLFSTPRAVAALGEACSELYLAFLCLLVRPEFEVPSEK
jgi:hypothetical protein